MSYRFLGLAAVAVVMLCADWAGAQIVGPARRAAAGAAAAAGAPGVGARIENREAERGITPGERWRYVNHGNQWWYYGPQNNWMYYRDNAWAPYDAAAYTGPAVPAAPIAPRIPSVGVHVGGTQVDVNDANRWRYVQHNNGWWYYTPQNSWMFYSGNQWQPYQAGAANPRYRTGYRGAYRAFNNEPRMTPPAAPMNPNMRGGAQMQNRTDADQRMRDGQIQQDQRPANERDLNRPLNQPLDQNQALRRDGAAGRQAGNETAVGAAPQNRNRLQQSAVQPAQPQTATESEGTETTPTTADSTP